MDLMNMKDMGKTRKSDFLGEDVNRGGNFDDMEKYSDLGCPPVRKIVGRSGCTVDSIAFFYDGDGFKHGGNGGTEVVFNLQEDEFITKVTGGTTRFDNRWTIAGMVFTTNKGREFKIGVSGSTGKTFQFEAKEGGSLACMFGRSDRYLELIGFYEVPVGKADGILGGGMPDASAVPGADKMPDAKAMPGISNMFGKK